MSGEKPTATVLGQITAVLSGDSEGCVVCGDCIDILPMLPDKCVDLVLTDPPYNVGVDYGNDYDDKKDDFVGWARLWFGECRRISETTLICGQARLPDYAIIEKWKWLLAWYKPASMGRSPVGFCAWEPVAMWGKGSSAGFTDAVRAPIILQKDTGNHPCPKPIEWGLGFLKRFPKATIIFAPFCGSGTTCVAAKKLGRRYIGIDISPNYCRIARERIAALETGVPVNETKAGQMALFEPPRRLSGVNEIRVTNHEPRTTSGSV